MSADVTVYSTQWCGYCVQLKRQMDRAGIAYEAVDIQTDPASEELVRQANRGSATVPTLVFRDGSVLTNPSLREVNDLLASLPAS